VGGLLAKLAVLRDTPQLLQRTALLVEHQVAPEGEAPLCDTAFCCVLLGATHSALVYSCSKLCHQAVSPSLSPSSDPAVCHQLATSCAHAA
jgi:hypothetical protein